MARRSDDGGGEGGGGDRDRDHGSECGAGLGPSAGGQDWYADAKADNIASLGRRQEIGVRLGDVGYPLIGSWNPKNRPSSGGGGVGVLVLLGGLAAYALYTVGDQAPECVAARVLLTGATVFAAKFECGLDALGTALTQQRSR
jgi:hypothetical protein